MIEMLQYRFMQRALFVTVAMAVLCPLIGIFLVVRRQSMTGDALAHASLAGVSTGLLFGHNPVAGAFIAAALAGLCAEWLRDSLRRYADLVLTVILAGSVGIAVTLMSSGLLEGNAEAFLFGSILTVTPTDMTVIGLLTLAAVGLLLRYRHALLYVAFDEEAAQLAGVPVKSINRLFALLVAATVAVAIQMTGVLVLSSMIAIPVATALQFHAGFRRTLAISVAVSLFDGLAGIVLSYTLGAAPGGLTALVSVALLLAVILARRTLRLRRNA